MGATYKLKHKKADGTIEEVAVPISTVDGLQTALDGKQPSGSYVTTNTAQTISGAKTLTNTLKIQSGNPAGAFVLGGNVSSTGLTANTRKLGRMGVPAYPSNGSTVTSTVAGISFDAQANANYADFGGHPRNTSSIAPDVIRFVVADSHDNNVAGNRTLAFQIAKQIVADSVDGATSFAGAKFFVPVEATGTIKATGGFVGDLTGTADDADKLGGQLPAYYLDYNNLTNKPTIPSGDGGVPFIASSDITVVAGEYNLATKWSVPSVGGVTEPTDGMIIAVRTPNGGAGGGVLLSIDGGSNYYPLLMNNDTIVKTVYSNNNTLILTFNPTATASVYITAGASTTVTGCWQIADYAEDNKVNQWHTTNDKDYPILFKYIAGTTSTSSSTTYTQYSNKIYVNPSTGTIYANDFVVDGQSIVGGGGGSAEPFIVTFTNNGNDNYTADATYQDIEQAFANGKIVIGKDATDSYIYQIFGLCDDDTIPFSRIVTWGEYGTTIVTLFVNTDDSVSCFYSTLATTALATATSKGLMSAEDKKKVDWLDLDTSDGTIFTIGDDSVTSAYIQLNNNDHSVNAIGEEIYIRSTFGGAHINSADGIYLHSDVGAYVNGSKVITEDTLPSAGGGSSNLTMPIIRMGAVSDVNGTMEISTDNPLTFKVEVIGGTLQAGDVLQVCGMQLYTYKNEDDTGRVRKYKMRSFANYEITAGDLTKQYISITIGGEGNESQIQDLLRGGGRSTSTVHNYHTKYLRIRREHPDNASNALFSNAVPFQAFGKWDRENSCVVGNITIR